MPSPTARIVAQKKRATEAEGVFGGEDQNMGTVFGEVTLVVLWWFNGISP